jgi:glycosyltransferase involved in cell wall biosynthesis
LVVGFVGLFVPWHGISFLIEVFQELAKKNSFLHLLLVGDGPERASIERKIKELNLLTRITITGYIHHSKIPAFIKAFDVAVMPDSNEYGSPMKIFEYMSMAKSIAAPAYSPILEVLKDKKNALIFEPNNKDSLYNALETLIEDEKLASQLGANARHDVFAKHTWKQSASEIIKLYLKKGE